MSPCLSVFSGLENREASWLRSMPCANVEATHSLYAHYLRYS